MAGLSNMSMFKAFRSSNYTLYFWGRSVSQFGTWMQRTAVVWVIYSLTHSAFMLGLTIFAEQFPSFFLSIFGGIAADRYNRYTIIELCQVVSMIQSALLAVLVMTGHYVIWEILTLSVLLGIINAFDIPARQALIHEVLYEESDLPNALSLTSAMASLAKLLGPALSGIILEKCGASICFLLNAASFGGVMISVMLMKLPAYKPPAIKKKVFADLYEGFAYLVKTPSIGLVILMLAIVSLLVMPYDTLIPVYAKVIFKGNAATFGYITSFIGVGAVCGTILMSFLKKGANLKMHLLVSIVILGLGLIAFSHTSYFPLAMLFATITGFGTVAQGTLSNIIIQSESPHEMRGRAISIMIMAMFGMLPIGSLVVGALSQKIGAPNTLLCQGIIGLVIAAVFFNILRIPKAVNIPALQADETEEAIIEKV
ncbi:Transmembrane secretion effector [Chitinophaga costaii]|uniref:Transmembrane secretion effector n=1 Tax=Chitinophaga costaii TaxID=1335309 RepID=A0A1C4CV57_9BACT|nr:MFS transporter [Chitinophaga costaii]PUZ26934.1 MFS transporter [Chitinophaga costaii]SCC22919.1 Transmembrane secretion effector [Chitinophaga costaii]